MYSPSSKTTVWCGSIIRRSSSGPEGNLKPAKINFTILYKLCYKFIHHKSFDITRPGYSRLKADSMLLKTRYPTNQNKCKQKICFFGGGKDGPTSHPTHLDNFSRSLFLNSCSIYAKCISEHNENTRFIKKLF